MRIDEVLRKENIGKKFKGFNIVWEVVEENDFGIYDSVHCFTDRCMPGPYR